MAPRMADRWPEAAMVAGHPNGFSVLALRNVSFALQAGSEDAAYNRNKVGRAYGEQLGKLYQDDPQWYQHFVKIHEGKGHWLDLDGKAALRWLAKFTRTAVPAGQMKTNSLIIAKHKGQNVAVTAAEKIETLLIRLDDQMADLDQPITVTYAGKRLFAGVPARTIEVMCKTLVGRGDPKLMFDAEVAVELGH